MTALVAKMMTLIALLLMPLGMAPAAAAPMPAAHHDMADMAKHHGDASSDDVGLGIAMCAMVCAAALPAFTPALQGSLALARLPLAPEPMKPLAAILLEIATPPPRSA